MDNGGSIEVSKNQMVDGLLLTLTEGLVWAATIAAATPAWCRKSPGEYRTRDEIRAEFPNPDAVRLMSREDAAAEMARVRNEADNAVRWLRVTAQ